MHSYLEGIVTYMQTTGHHQGRFCFDCSKPLGSRAASRRPRGSMSKSQLEVPVLRQPLIFTFVTLILSCVMCSLWVPSVDWGFGGLRSACARYRRSACTHAQESHRQGLPGFGRYQGSSGVPAAAPSPSPCSCLGPYSLAPLSSQRGLLQGKLARITLPLRAICTSPDHQERKPGTSPCPAGPSFPSDSPPVPSSTLTLSLGAAPLEHAACSSTVGPLLATVSTQINASLQSSPSSNVNFSVGPPGPPYFLN